MRQKGFTLLEVVSVILIMGMMSYSMKLSATYLEEVQFKHLVEEVEKGVICAQQMAAMTGENYKVCCMAHEIYIKKGIEKPLYTFKVDDEITLPGSMTGGEIYFHGKMAPQKGGTIELIHTKLHKKARITVRIATGKTRIYYEKL